MPTKATVRITQKVSVKHNTAALQPVEKCRFNKQPLPSVMIAEEGGNERCDCCSHQSRSDNIANLTCRESHFREIDSEQHAEQADRCGADK